MPNPTPRKRYKALSRESFVMIISDHGMPQMTGVVVMTHVRNLSPHSLRIVISGSGGVNEVADAINTAGIHRYGSGGSVKRPTPLTIFDGQPLT